MCWYCIEQWWIIAVLLSDNGVFTDTTFLGPYRY